MIAACRFAFGASTPRKQIRCSLGRGTSAVRRYRNSAAGRRMSERTEYDRSVVGTLASDRLLARGAERQRARTVATPAESEVAIRAVQAPGR
jgi:hypothetical protein